MLLQVHDELIFEAPEGEVEAAIPVIRDVDGERRHAGAFDARCRCRSTRAPRDNWDEAH